MVVPKSGVVGERLELSFGAETVRIGARAAAMAFEGGFAAGDLLAVVGFERFGKMRRRAPFVDLPEQGIPVFSSEGGPLAKLGGRVTGKFRVPV